MLGGPLRHKCGDLSSRPVTLKLCPHLFPSLDLFPLLQNKWFGGAIHIALICLLTVSGKVGQSEDNENAHRPGRDQGLCLPEQASTFSVSARTGRGHGGGLDPSPPSRAFPSLHNLSSSSLDLPAKYHLGHNFSLILCESIYASNRASWQDSTEQSSTEQGRAR